MYVLVYSVCKLSDVRIYFLQLKSKKFSDLNNLSSRGLRRQYNMNLIRNGYKSTSIPLNNNSNKSINSENKVKQKRNKRKLNNKKVGE